jgi:AbrB family looped-hinge helix DNA binding protein
MLHYSAEVFKMTAISKVTRSYQVTIPAEIRKKAGITMGTILGFELREDGILLTPQRIVPDSQAWFFSEEWQAEEKEADEDIKAGRVSPAMTVQEMKEYFNAKNQVD